MGRFDHLKPLVTTLPALMCKSASCYNPFVYAIGHPKFRQVNPSTHYVKPLKDLVADIMCEFGKCIIV